MVKYVNIEIGGLPLLASEITPVEAFNRYELTTKKLLNGGAVAHQGEYVLREFNFKTSLEINIDEPEEHYKVLLDLMKEPVLVVCPEMNAHYNAVVVFKPVRDTPSSIELDVNVKEVPEKKK